MKKILVLFIAIMSSIVSFAQSLEVRGVETKLVVYEGSEYKVHIGWNKRSGDQYKYSTKWFGYSFYNMNSIPISIEAELYMINVSEEEEKPKLVDTKTFNLRSKETFIWKHEKKTGFRVNDTERYAVLQTLNFWTDSKTEPNCVDSSVDAYKFFVKYKAYKIL